MRKFGITAILMIAALAVYAATTKVLVSTAPGTRDVQSFNVGKPVHIEAIGCLPATGTVVLKRISGDVTNTLTSITCSGGLYNGGITSTNYVLAGDTLLFGGTYTSGVVRVILTAD